MPKYVIERDIPGAGKLSAADLHGISAKSCGVLQQLGPSIQWVQSYVTDDKVYCVYIAPNEAPGARAREARRFPGKQGVGRAGNDRPDDGRVGPRRAPRARPAPARSRSEPDRLRGRPRRVRGTAEPIAQRARPRRIRPGCGRRFAVVAQHERHLVGPQRVLRAQLVVEHRCVGFRRIVAAAGAGVDARAQRRLGRRAVDDDERHAEGRGERAEPVAMRAPEEGGVGDGDVAGAAPPGPSPRRRARRCARWRRRRTGRRRSPSRCGRSAASPCRRLRSTSARIRIAPSASTSACASVDLPLRQGRG